MKDSVFVQGALLQIIQTLYSNEALEQNFLKHKISGILISQNNPLKEVIGNDLGGYPVTLSPNVDPQSYYFTYEEQNDKTGNENSH